MYSGFISPRKVIKKIGVHQKLDTAAYKIIEPFVAHGKFPNLSEILHFEGLNGPDGIKIKGGINLKESSHEDPSHMYDPVDGKGELPALIRRHYDKLVSSLKEADNLRASFEAAWLAHFLVDGMTPAHHFPYDEKKAELFGAASDSSFWKRHWGWWGVKGVFSTHMNFEMGIASALLLAKLKVNLDHAKMAEAAQMGPIKFFRNEALKLSYLNLYEKFYKRGWTAELASASKNVIAPTAVQVVAIVWLMAYLEAGFQSATEI